MKKLLAELKAGDRFRFEGEKELWVVVEESHDLPAVKVMRNTGDRFEAINTIRADLPVELFGEEE